jgi:hypothetical protein
MYQRNLLKEKAMTKKIIVIIKPDAETEISASGFSGSDCYKATAPFEELLGDNKTDKKTEDFYRGNTQVKETENE